MLLSVLPLSANPTFLHLLSLRRVLNCHYRNCHYTKGTLNSRLSSNGLKKNHHENSRHCISTTLSISVNLTASLPHNQKVEIIFFCVWKAPKVLCKALLWWTARAGGAAGLKVIFLCLIAHNLELRCCISMSCGTWALLNFNPPFGMWTLLGGWAGRGLRFILAVPKGAFTWCSQHCWPGIDWESSLGKFGSIWTKMGKFGGRVFCAETRNYRNNPCRACSDQKGGFLWQEGKCDSLCALSQCTGP